MKRIFSALALLMCGAVLHAQTPIVTDLSGRIDILSKNMLSRPVAGISVAVSRRGQVVFARGYGVANLEHSVAVSPETVFHICSISKNILAAVVLQLVDEGRLKLDDDLTKHVPEAPTHGQHVTVRQLLNHTSGIYSFTSLPDAENNERLDLTHDQVLSLIRDRPLDFEPGTSWRYDNSAFYLAGMVVERITGQDYGAYVREHVFKPLGMSSATMCDARMVVPRLASGYEMNHGMLVNASLISWKLPFAAGAVCATATDLLKWQAALDSGSVIGAPARELMRTPATLADGTRIDYGLGTRLGSLETHRVLGHTGSGGGFNGVLESFPDDGLSIAVLMNTGNAAAPSMILATAIARAALGLPDMNAPRDLSVPPKELAALLGDFDSDEGAIVNFARDGRLHFRVPGTQKEGVLLRQAENVYAINENAEVHFLVRDGRATWGIVYSDGLMADAIRRGH
jgi:CubicO group peptidase (beta-lactamase class C family)